MRLTRRRDPVAVKLIPPGSTPTMYWVSPLADPDDFVTNNYKCGMAINGRSAPGRDGRANDASSLQAGRRRIGAVEVRTAPRDRVDRVLKSSGVKFLHSGWHVKLRNVSACAFPTFLKCFC